MLSEEKSANREREQRLTVEASGRSRHHSREAEGQNASAARRGPPLLGDLRDGNIPVVPVDLEAARDDDEEDDEQVDHGHDGVQTNRLFDSNREKN